MTHHTDAEQLHQLLELVLTELDRKAIPIAYMQEIDRKGKAFIEQAARRAPAVPVTPVTDAMREAAEEAYMPFGDMGLAIQCALAAAPQPPEAGENPLQEPLDEALQSLEFYKRRCDLLQSIQPRMRDPERTMVCDVLANGHLLQGGDGQPDKARYAPPEAAPVPQFSRIAQKKLDYLLEAGEAITGYAIENKDGRRGAIDCHGFVYWWQDAAAPQPPANET